MPATPTFRVGALIACLCASVACSEVATAEPGAELAASAAAGRAAGLGSAIDAFTEGRYEEVLTLLARAPATPELRYLAARTLAELDRPGEALARLGEPSASWPEIVLADVRSSRLRWAADAGRCSEVEALAGQTPAAETERLLSRCAFAAGNYARAKALLAEAKDVDGQGMYVRALIALNERGAAEPLARRFYVEHPAHRDAAACAEFLRGRDAKPALSVEEHFTRSQRWVDARQPELAFAELKNLDKRVTKKQRAELWHLRGEALFRTRQDYDEAERAYTRAVSFKGEHEAHDAFQAIRAASRAGRDRFAIQRYKAYPRRYPKSEFVPDALYLSAWLSAREKRGSAREALVRFVDSDAGKRAPGLRRDAIWDLAWLALSRDDGHDAQRWLERYAQLANKPLEQARTAYWQGRAALMLREKGAARGHLERAIAADRLGYYAQLAARKLIALGEPPPSAFDPAAQTPDAPAVQVPSAVAFYRDLGLHADAARVAQAWIDALPDRHAKVAAVLHTGDAAKSYATAEPLLTSALAAVPVTSERWLWSALFPRPYAATVEEQTAQNSLPSALFYGHMQVESRYKPRAVSGADAIGLMQLLPSTAAKVATKLPVRSDRAALMRPHVNVTLAAHYLSGLVQHYRGQFPLAIAAYNAGSHRVDGWLTRSGPVELDRWVENIPVEQTRNYVRRVITAWGRYHALDQPTDPWGIPLPERVSLPTE